MSLFSDQTLRTRYLDPISHNNNNVEFQLDNQTGFTANMRIIGLGSHRTVNHSYNDAVGVLGKIRAIHLESNGQKIDSLRECNRFLAFQNLLKSNQQQNSLIEKDNKSARGLIVYSAKQAIDARSRTVSVNASAALAAREATLGSLNLMDVFPVLRAMSHIDTSVMKNVKVRVEYETKAEKLMSSTAGAAAADPIPVLVVEQFQDNADVAKMTKAMGSVVWDTIEHDQIRVDAITNQSTTVKKPVDTSKKLMAFNNKYVSKVVVMKESSAAASILNGTTVIGYGHYASQAQFEEKFNCRLNGKNMFVGAGLDSPAKMTAMCADAWGTYVLTPGDDETSLGVNDELATMNARRAKGARPIQSNKQNDRVGQSSFIGFHVEDNVKDMQLEYSRTGLSDSTARFRYNSALNLHVFAEVRKQLVMKGDKFMVSYM